MTGDDSRLTAAPTRRRRLDHGAEPALRVQQLDDGDTFREISFSLRPGEVVGLAGSAGSGKVGVAESIAGLRLVQRHDPRRRSGTEAR